MSDYYQHGMATSASTSSVHDTFCERLDRSWVNADKLVNQICLLVETAIGSRIQDNPAKERIKNNDSGVLHNLAERADVATEKLSLAMREVERLATALQIPLQE